MASLGRWGALVCAFVAHGCGDDVTGVAPGDSGSATESGSTTLSSDSATTQSTTVDSASESATSNGPTSSATSDGPTSASATSTSGATDSGDTTSGGTTMSVDPTDGGTTTGDDTTGDSADTSSTGMGSSSTGVMVCDAGADETEPNDAETATDALDDVTCDNMPATGQGTLDGVVDVDWFQFFENWPANCGQDPNPRVSVAVDNNLQVCAYFDCNFNTTEVSCTAGAPDTSPEDGWPGCCAQDAVLVDLNCSSTSDESAQVRLSVSDGPPAACTPYTVIYAVEAYDD